MCRSKYYPSLKLHTQNTYLSTCCSNCYQSLKLLPLLHLLPLAKTATAATAATTATTATTAATATYYHNYPNCYPLYNTNKACAFYTYISGSRVGVLIPPPPSLP